ncbi:hypothetical protein [Amantichitinum ursilacus]|uniref:O-Antigen ligase n=1 Tax=Amantichitinum ursilacus TaxID=857265 RepID=A0A0N1JSD4_9NEIS|nr:hypothetical protein [Amantichitinum ursilacus]KPC51822.1 hypothetical protein WG78_15165 [Amantichitinum ursilacus]
MRLALDFNQIQLHPAVYRVYDFLARWVPPVLRWTALVLLCLFVGYSIALGGTFVSIFWCAVACMVLLPLIITQQNQMLREGTVYFCLFYIMILPLGTKLISQSLYGPPQVLLVVTGLLGLPAFLRYCMQSRLLTWSMVAFVLFVVFAGLSTWLGRSRTMPALNQGFNDLKVLMMITCGFLAVWPARAERIIDRFARYYWMFAAAVVAFEWGAPSIYFTIFKHDLTSRDPTHLFPSRANGPTDFPVYLAATSSFFMIYCFSRMLTSKNWRPWLFATAGNAMVLLFSVQRQALLGAILACFLVMLLSRPQVLIRRAVMALFGLAVVGSVIGSVYIDYVMRDLNTYGSQRTTTATAPRAVIFQTSVDIARQYFPLGAGLGTYGGSGAFKYDDSLYYESGFNRLPWFREANYLMDTYWPNPIGETGLLGAGSLLLCYVLMTLFTILKAFKAVPETRMYWLLCAGTNLSVLQLTATHPAYTEPRLFLLTAITLAWAATREREARLKAQPEVASAPPSGRLRPMGSMR